MNFPTITFTAVQIPSAGWGRPSPEPEEDNSRSVRERCAYCSKRQGDDGMPLKKCVGCKTDRYCSRKCQKAAWPVHKQRCKIEVQIRLAPETFAIYLTGEAECPETLECFLNIHVNAISQAAVNSVRHHYLPPSCPDPVAASKEREDVLVIDLQTRLYAHHLPPKMRFCVTDAQQETLAYFPPREREGLRLKLQRCREEATDVHGPCGSMLVLLRVAGSQYTGHRVVTYMFSLDPNWLNPRLHAGLWKELLFTMLNNGLVL